MAKLISITGGIGAGKSVVSNALRDMGWPVYDCDSQAKRLMDESDAIKREISSRISPEAIHEGAIDRKVLASIVFAEAEKLAILNSITHAAVRADICQWASCQSSALVFVETAILYQSGLDKMVDAVWEVVAPLEIRAERVMARNCMTRAEVDARIASQEYVPERPHPLVSLILNDGRHSILSQLHTLLAQALS